MHEALNRKIDSMADFLSDPSLVSLQGFDLDASAMSDDNPMDSNDMKEFYSDNEG